MMTKRRRRRRRRRKSTTAARDKKFRLFPLSVHWRTTDKRTSKRPDHRVLRAN